MQQQEWYSVPALRHTAETDPSLSFSIQAEANPPVLENELQPTPAEIAQMRDLIRRIGRRSVLQKSVLAQLGEQRLPTSTIRALVTLLQGPFADRWRERLVAVWALGRADLAPGHRSAVAAALRDALTNSHTRSDVYLNDRGQSAWTRALPLAGGVGIAVALWAFRDLLPTLPDDVFGIIHRLLLSLLVSGLLGLIASFFASFLLFPFVLPISYAVDSARNLRVRAEAATALGRLRLPQCAGALARAALDINSGVRRTAEAALRATLPTLTSDHYGRLDAQTVPNLCRLLNIRRQQLFADHARVEDLVVELLVALGKVGDGNALPLVESIAVDGWTERARQTARSVLPTLRERLRHEQDQGMLLRGAVAPSSSKETLLHVVSEDAASQPELLLRPALDSADGTISSGLR